MKRYTGQKALYEAISRSRAKAKRGNILERFLPDATRQEKPAPPEEQPRVEPLAAPPAVPQSVAKEPREPLIVRENAKLRRLATMEKVEVPPEKPAVPVAKLRPVEKTDRPARPPRPIPMWWRLKPVQLNAGRVEVSVPYHIGVVIVLAVTLVILVAYRMGQKHPLAKAKAAVPTKASVQATKQNAAATETTVPKASQSAPPVASSPASEPAQPQGDNWIVLKYSKQKADLDDAKEFFGKNGIDVDVVSVAEVREVFAKRQLNQALLPKSDGFLLVTNSLYNNPDNPGTDGYAMKQKIAEVGKKYKAKPGRDTFAPKFFSDAYGMKLSKVGQQER